MKLEVGIYVRTKKGIDKIIDRILEPDHYYFKMWVTDKFLEINDDTEYISEVDVIKASYNIIDILEVGDIISFYEDIDNYKKQYVIGIPDLITLDEIKDKITNDNIRLVSILTKEQMEQIAYKVGE